MKINHFFNGLSFFFVFLLWLFSLTPNIFAPLHPDEIIANELFDFGGGLAGCVWTYYADTTINRFSAALGICSAASITDFFVSPYFGWVVGRSLFYTVFSGSLAFYLSTCLRLSFLHALLPALLISSILQIGLAQHKITLYGLDLAIYVTGFSAALIFLGLSFNGLVGATGKKIACLIVLFGALTSHEFYFPFFGLYLGLVFIKSDFSLIKSDLMQIFRFHFWKNRKFYLSLVIVYIISFLLLIMAPSLSTRMNVWPADYSTASFGRVWDVAQGLIKQVWYREAQWSIAAVAGFLFGMFSPINHSVAKIIRQQILFTVTLFLTIAVLIGLVPSLAIVATVDLNSAPRHTFCFFASVAIIHFLLGFLLGNWVFKEIWLKTLSFSKQISIKRVLQRIQSFTIFLFFLSLLHWYPWAAQSTQSFGYYLIGGGAPLAILEREKVSGIVKERETRSFLYNTDMVSDRHHLAKVAILHDFANQNENKTAMSNATLKIYQKSGTTLPHSDLVWHNKYVKRLAKNLSFECINTIPKIDRGADVCGAARSLDYVTFDFSQPLNLQEEIALPRFGEFNVKVTEHQGCVTVDSGSGSSAGEQFGFVKVQLGPGLYAFSLNKSDSKERVHVVLSSPTEIFRVQLTNSIQKSEGAFFEGNLHGRSGLGNENDKPERQLAVHYLQRNSRSGAVKQDHQILFEVLKPHVLTIRLQQLTLKRSGVLDVCDVKLHHVQS